MLKTIRINLTKSTRFAKNLPGHMPTISQLQHFESEFGINVPFAVKLALTEASKSDISAFLIKNKEQISNNSIALLETKIRLKLSKDELVFIDESDSKISYDKFIYIEDYTEASKPIYGHFFTPTSTQLVLDHTSKNLAHLILPFDKNGQGLYLYSQAFDLTELIV